MMKRFSLLLLLATTLSLGGCSALEDLVQEATNWIEDARSENDFEAIENPSDYDGYYEDDYSGDPFFTERPGETDVDDQVFFFAIAGQGYAVAELELEESDIGPQMYLEFERNDAFIPLQPDPLNDSATEWAFTAKPNFNQDVRFDVRLDYITLDGRFEFNGQPAELILRGSGANARVVGINLPNQGDYGFHSEEYPDGNLSD